MIAARLVRDVELLREPLDSCVCGQCKWCPDGWHGDAEGCGCTADCVLGDEHCPECGYCALSFDEEVGAWLCRVCGECPAPDEFDAPWHHTITVHPNPAYL